MRLRILSGLIVFTAASFAQLTVEQKLSDFQQTVGVFVKNYAPLEWKKSLLGFDVSDTAPWLARIRATTSDLEFYQVMAEWTASLEDGHVSYFNPSYFRATLNFSADLYDDRLLVDSIDRTRLPVAEYPFAAGDEVVSIDGEDALKILERLTKFMRAGNPRMTRRMAAQGVTMRPEYIYPGLANVPDISTVVFRRLDGHLETHRIPWSKVSVPLPGKGKPPAPHSALRSAEVPQTPDAAEPVTVEPPYMQPLRRLMRRQMPESGRYLNFGTPTPFFVRGLPASFVQRLGRSTSDYFFSGTYQAGGYRIGFLRIPTFAPRDPNAAYSQFYSEIQFMRGNTDGLVLDISRNPGGNGDYLYALLELVHHYPFDGTGFAVRATSNWIASFSAAYESAKALRAPPDVLDAIQRILDALIEANRGSRALTAPIPLDGDTELRKQPARDVRGNLAAYYNPVLVLTDEFSASAADEFAAVIQDNGRGPLFGFRTAGLGGSVSPYASGSYSEAELTVTESLMVRKFERAETGPYPVTAYVENVGVRPDIDYDVMTRENLLQGGRPFVEAFTQAMVDWIGRNR